MSIREFIKAVGSAAKGFLGKVLNSDILAVVKAGALIGSAIGTAVKALKMFKKSTKARTGESDDTMTGFVRFATANGARNKVNETIAKTRKIFSESEFEDDDDEFESNAERVFTEDLDDYMGFEARQGLRDKKSHKKEKKIFRYKKAEKHAKKKNKKKEEKDPFAGARLSDDVDSEIFEDDLDDLLTKFKKDHPIPDFSDIPDPKNGPIWVRYLDEKNPGHYVHGFNPATC